MGLILINPVLRQALGRVGSRSPKFSIGVGFEATTFWIGTLEYQSIRSWVQLYELSFPA